MRRCLVNHSSLLAREIRQAAYLRKRSASTSRTVKRSLEPPSELRSSQAGYPQREGQELSLSAQKPSPNPPLLMGPTFLSSIDLLIHKQDRALLLHLAPQWRSIILLFAKAIGEAWKWSEKTLRDILK